MLRMPSEREKPCTAPARSTRLNAYVNKVRCTSNLPLELHFSSSAASEYADSIACGEKTALVWALRATVWTRRATLWTLRAIVWALRATWFDNQTREARVCSYDGPIGRRKPAEKTVREFQFWPFR
eukprot:376630-Prorocentrum_minimum.AAC.1